MDTLLTAHVSGIDSAEWLIECIENLSKYNESDDIRDEALHLLETNYASDARAVSFVIENKYQSIPERLAAYKDALEVRQWRARSLFLTVFKAGGFRRAVDQGTGVLGLMSGASTRWTAG